MNIKRLLNLKGFSSVASATLVLFALTVSVPASAALIVNPAQTITRLVNVQPIVVSDDDGSNTATFFGDTTQQGIIEGFIDTIFAQAGIDVNFLAPNSWNSTFANWGLGGPPNNNGNTRPTSDLSQVVSDGTSAGVTHADPNVINMFMVNIPAGFDALTANTAAGLAYVGASGITQFVGANLLDFTGGREVVASVVSHELAHNLGLPHLLENENLMQSAGSPNQGERLNADQINTIRNSQFTTVVPVPPAVWLFICGLAGLVGVARRRVQQQTV